MICEVSETNMTSIEKRRIRYLVGSTSSSVRRTRRENVDFLIAGSVFPLP